MLSRTCRRAIGVAEGATDGLYLLLAFLVLEILVAPFLNEVIVQLPVETSVQTQIYGSQGD